MAIRRTEGVLASDSRASIAVSQAAIREVALSCPSGQVDCGREEGASTSRRCRQTEGAGRMGSPAVTFEILASTKEVSGTCL